MGAVFFFIIIKHKFIKHCFIMLNIINKTFIFYYKFYYINNKKYNPFTHKLKL